MPPTLPVIEVAAPPAATSVRPDTERRAGGQEPLVEEARARAPTARLRPAARQIQERARRAKLAKVAQVGAADVRHALADQGVLLHPIRRALSPITPCRAAPSPRHTRRRMLAPCATPCTLVLSALAFARRARCGDARTTRLCLAIPAAPADETLAQRIAPPPGFERTAAAPGAWARGCAACR